ncbi:ribosome assembly RNA-binding protein YhbY [Peptoniphilus equinus]|uniref:Ribosome assembly RNA-binding protein YhbY n=1 Tax=Peptoniphilus equinus TaxID=3016343 RepID=A0ABY7QTJ6_9FIRM|nr:ribosome assembly RNA-binding protein YhbY [Peptoniphilus equinus]WBW49213.1 ribosome assembly RNA-binding protein YhbY [Peptoniphilus equinus]
MITGRQRSYLKGLANGLSPLIQVGKGGLTPGLIDQIDVSLEDHELVKITVLNNAPVEVKEIVDEILDATGAEFVQSIGSKLTLYRPSKEHPTIDLQKL